MRASRLVVTLALTVLARTGAAGESPCAGGLRFYGTYSVGTKAGDGKVALPRRLEELRDLGANMIVGTGDDTRIPDLLPPEILAVPGCGLMKEEDWKLDGKWDEAHARQRLAKLGSRFAHHPRVYGVCLTHEVTEYASHERRRWMYRLAKEYFGDKKVIHYYGVLWDRENPEKKKVEGYGEGGEVETDVLFVSLPAVHRRRFSDDPKRLAGALAAVARTPEIPLWGQTSINADNKSVTGPESMVAVWGAHGENMSRWADRLLAMKGDAAGQSCPPRLSAFFWRSLGRFPWDLGYPSFADHRRRMQAIGKKHRRTS